MLHLAPRLHAAQEQRIAVGVDGPDLTRITRFAALLPADRLDQHGDLALHLFALRNDQLPPFYLERLLNRLDRAPGQGDAMANEQSKGYPPGEQPLPTDRLGIFDGGGGVAQRRASLLLDAAGDALLPLQWQETDRRKLSEAASVVSEPKSRAKSVRKGLPWPFRRSHRAADSDETLQRSGEQPLTTDASTTPLDLPTRRHAFRAALQTGDRIAHMFASNIIDPIRADTHVPSDPFVQTTLYVIAPLYEPVTSALIWPTIAHQLHYLGQRHIAQVVGIFATGSYATDSSRIIEDASCYAAIAELEALTGLRRANLTQFQSLLQEDSSAQLALSEEWLGRSLFDRIYLVDREKSNQGLARNSYELSVLVGNTLQALIAADGAAYVDEQIGIDLRNARERPYSLLGAAADHVPLDYIFQAVQEQEVKRLVREQILFQVEPDTSAMAAQEEVQGPGAEVAHRANTELETLATLNELGATPQQVLSQLIEQMPDLFDELAPESIQQLSAHPDTVLSPATARKLRGLNPIRWQVAFDEHFRSVLDQFERSIDAGALDKAWGLAALRKNGLPRNPGDTRFLPTISRQMREYLLTLLSAQPSGLLQARHQLQQWLTELEQERHALATELLPGEHRLPHDAGRSDSAGQGERDADAAGGAHRAPTEFASRPLGANRLERQLDARRWRARYLRTLADQPSLFGSLTRALFLLGGVLLMALLYARVFLQPVDVETIFTFFGMPVDVQGISTFFGMLIGAFLGAILTYRARLRRARKLRRERVTLACLELTARLQDHVRRGLARTYDYLEQMLRQMDHALEDTCEALQEWSVGAGMPPLPPEEGIASHLYRPHLNPRLWERCQTFLRGRQDSEGRQGEERLREIWTSLPKRQQLAALLTGADATTRPLVETLFDTIRESAQTAVAGLHDSDANLARLDLVRTLTREYNLEHLLWRDVASSQGFTPFYPDGEFTPVATTTLRYLESMWNAAKPSANYDVSDRMAAYGLPVEFAAVSGDPDSDLTEAVMQSVRIPRLLTGNPFQITFVRTVHGLELQDLGSMARYLTELGRLDYASRQQILLTEAAYAELYNQRDARDSHSV